MMKIPACLGGWLPVVVFLSPAAGQTLVDLRTQGKSVDFAGAASTRPVKTGTTLPSTCMSGELFFKVDAPEGENLYGCSAANTWHIQGSSGAGSGVANYAKAFAAQTVVTILGAEHAFDTTNLIVACYDNGVPTKQVEPHSISVDSGTYDVVVSFSSPQSGKCVINGTVASQTGVSSAFGRTGAVVAMAGDYTAAQVTNTPAGNIAATTVQAALNELDTEKSSTSHGHSVGGDLSGTVASATVTKLQGRAVSSSAPTNGQVLAYNSGTAQWEPTTGAGGGGATNATDLYDLKTVRTSSTILTINENCTFSKPCLARFRHTVYSFTSSATAAISAGTGTAYLYVDSSGSITVGTGGTLTVSCSGCVTNTNSSFPPDSIPIATWTATGGAWDVAGGTDQRAFLSTTRLIGGAGIVVNEASSTVALDTTAVWVRVAVPATAGSACTPGQVAHDSNYAYFCVASNTWKRTGLSTW